MPIMKQKKKLKELVPLSYFDKNTLSQLMDLSDNCLYANIKRWLKSGDIIQLKRGMYVTREYYLIVPNKSAYADFIANKLREPSYLSMEYVLQQFGMLTEAVYSFTSITLKSNRTYSNNLGTFVYRNLNSRLFLGYEIREDDGFSIKVATKSKALFDYLYLKTRRIHAFDKDYLLSLRLNVDEFSKDDMDEFEHYCKLAGPKKYLELPAMLGDAYDL